MKALKFCLGAFTALAAGAAFAVSFLEGPESGQKETRTDPVEVDDGITVENPFRLIGRGGELTLDGDAAKLQANAPLNFSGSGRFVFKAGLDYTTSDWLTFGNDSGNAITYEFWNFLRMHGTAGIGWDTDGNEYEPARMTVSNATVYALYGYPMLTVASAGKENGEDVGGNGSLVLDNATVDVYSCYVSRGNLFTNTKSDKVPIGRVELRNGSVLKVSNEFQLSGSDAKPSDAGSHTNVIVLGENSVVEATPRLSRFDGPSGLILFDGGRMRKPFGCKNPFLHEGGYGNNDSLLHIQSTAGHDLVFECNALGETHLFDIGISDAVGNTKLVSDGAFVKEGRGRLRLQRAGSAFVFNGLKVNGGELFLYNNQTFNGGHKHGALTLAAGAAFDMYNNNVTTELRGSGVIYSSYAAAPATLYLGAFGDETTDVAIGEGAKVEKSGDGTTTIRAEAMDAPSVKVNAGTLKLTSRNDKLYRHYRYTVTALRSPGEVLEVADFRLLDGEADVTGQATLSYDNVTVQTGSTKSMFGGNEEPEKAVDLNLQNKWCDLRRADQNAWWLRFDYKRPVRVTGYQWAWTGNVGRAPKSWKLEASDDGETWTLLSEVSEYDVTKTSTAQNWIGNGQVFPCAIPVDAHSAQKLGDVTIAAGATLDLSALADDVEITSLSGDGQLVLGSGRCTLRTKEGEETVLPKNLISGSPVALVLTGGGSFKMVGSALGPTDIVLENGALRVLPEAFGGKFLRFTIKRARGTQDNSDMGKLHFYAADGSVINEGLAWYGADTLPTDKMFENSKDGTPAKDLPPGTFSQGGKYAYSFWRGSHEGPMNIFKDATDKTKWTIVTHTFDEKDESTWYVLNIRLADDAAPLVSYNLRTICSGDDNHRRIANWSLEGSVDGETWHLLDEQALGGNAPAGNAEGQWYNNGIPYVVDLPEDGSDVLGADVSLAIASGATYASVTPIPNLIVDCEAGAGAITTFNPSEGGTLKLVNAGEAELDGFVVPVTVGSFAKDASKTLKSWTVVVDGVANPKLRVVVKDGRLTVVKKSGLTIMIL